MDQIFIQQIKEFHSKFIPVSERTAEGNSLEKTVDMKSILRFRMVEFRFIKIDFTESPIMPGFITYILICVPFVTVNVDGSFVYSLMVSPVR